VRRGILKFKACRRQFTTTVRIRTAFEDSHIQRDRLAYGLPAVGVLETAA
jgi:hypothetical protein